MHHLIPTTPVPLASMWNIIPRIPNDDDDDGDDDIRRYTNKHVSKPRWCYVPQDDNFKQKNIAPCLGIAKPLSAQQFVIRRGFAVQLKPHCSLLTSYFTNVIFYIS